MSKYKLVLEKPDFNKRIVVYKNNKVISTSEWNHPESTMFHVYKDIEYIQHGGNGEIYWRIIERTFKQLTELGTIYPKVKLAKVMLDSADQPNDYMKAIISEHNGRIRVQWVNGYTAVVDNWSYLNIG